jgi:hypothetical protein
MILASQPVSPILHEQIGVQKKVPENGTSSTNVVTANSEKELVKLVPKHPNGTLYYN